MELKVMIKEICGMRNEKVEECKFIYQNAVFNNELNSMCIKHVDKLIFTHLNINSLRNKFEFLVKFVKSKVDILMISETKVDGSFPLGQFKINGFNAPVCLDCNTSGGGIMVFVWENIPAKLIGSEKPPIEGFYVEMNLGKQR